MNDNISLMIDVERIDGGKGERDRSALIQMLETIQEESKELFENPLKVGYERPPYEMPGDPHPFYYLSEELLDRLNRVLPFLRRERYLFKILPGLSGAAAGREDIICSIYNKRIVGIAEEKLQEYAKGIQATRIVITEEFEDPDPTIRVRNIEP